MNELSPFVLALRGRIEAERLRHRPEPDVVDVIDRALALDESAVPQSLRDSVAAQIDDDAADVPDATLAAFTAALSRRVESHADARRLEPLPERQRAARWPWLAAVAVAAAAVAIVSLSPSFETQSIAERVRSDLEAAERSIESERASGHAIERGEAPRRSPSVRPPAAVSPIEAPVISTPAPRPARAGLDELEARAHAKWKAGDLAGAEAALRDVIRRSGRTRRAELAYADLFAVAHQRGGHAAQSRVWRAYLSRFPQGRFADDVRAGLCRRASATQRSACWTTYLEHHPDGAHSGQARKAVATQPR